MWFLFSKNYKLPKLIWMFFLRKIKDYCELTYITWKYKVYMIYIPIRIDEGEIPSQVKHFLYIFIFFFLFFLFSCVVFFIIIKQDLIVLILNKKQTKLKLIDIIIIYYNIFKIVLCSKKTK